MKTKAIIYIFILSALPLSCLPDTSGKSPPSNSLIYPVGLAITASDDYLLVANSNFDLKYNAGTLVAVSLDKLDEIIDAGGNADWISKDNRFLYIPEKELIDANSTIRLAAFASDLQLTPNKKRAILPIRGGTERHILIVDVDELAQNGRVLNCDQDDDLSCSDEYRVTGNSNVLLPIEPYAVTSLELPSTIPDDSQREVPMTNTIGFATHLASGAVSVFQIENSQGEIDPELLSVVNNVVPEAGGIAANPTNNEIYVSGRKNPDSNIAILKLLRGGTGGTYTNKAFSGLTDRITLSGDLMGGTDLRGIAVKADGTGAVAVSRTPEALISIDTVNRRMTDLITLGTDPSVVSLLENETGAYSFVLCFKSNQVFIVDHQTMQVYVRVVGSGPQAVTFDKKRNLAYIANFRESTITLLHSTPPFEHVSVKTSGENAKLMIGIPRLPENNN